MNWAKRCILILVVTLLPVMARSHTWEQVQEEHKRMGIEPSGEIEKLTRAYEAQGRGLVHEQLHAAQHEMLLNSQTEVNKAKCVDLLARLSILDRKIKKLEASGAAEKAEKVALQRAQADGFIRTHCNFIPQ